MSRIAVKDLTRFTLLQGLTDDEISEFHSRLKEKRYKEEEIVFSEGDEERAIYFLVSGKVEM